MLQALRPNSAVASLPEGAKQVLHVNNFNVDYRPDGSIQQFNSDLSVWDVDGHELQRNAIFVNKPLRFVRPPLPVHGLDLHDALVMVIVMPMLNALHLVSRSAACCVLQLICMNCLFCVEMTVPDGNS